MSFRQCVKNISYIEGRATIGLDEFLYIDYIKRPFGVIAMLMNTALKYNIIACNTVETDLIIQLSESVTIEIWTSILVFGVHNENGI